MTGEAIQVERPTNLLRVKQPRMYRGAYRDEVDEPETTPATQNADPSATPNADPEATPTNGPELSPEDKVYKQRYDSLKTHYDKTVNADRTEIAQLRAQLAQASTQNMALPKTAKELNEWASKYPDLYGTIVTLVRQELGDKEQNLNTRLSQVEAESASAKRMTAEAKLMKMHPDLPDLLVSKDFHDWVALQPIEIQKGLYENTEDYMLAARYIDLYKADKALRDKSKTPKPRADVRAAAQPVTRPQQVEDVGTPQGKTYRTSEISRMNRKTFERLEADIDLARKEGRLIIDS